MNRIAKFEKVSFEQFKKDWLDTFNTEGLSDDYNIDQLMHEMYDNIKLPKRATTGSAGYDFFAPATIKLPKDFAVKIPTGIRCKIENGWVLQAYPRSGMGFKHGVSLANTVGIIDSDYYNSNNEGHIFIKLVNDCFPLANELKIETDSAFCQGIFVPFGVTEDDDADGVRNGGFGSTSR